MKWTLNNNKAYKVYGHCCCFEFNFIGIVIVEEKLIWQWETQILEKDENNLVTLKHFKKHKIYCIFHFTFMKQLKPVKDDFERESKKVRKTKVTKGPQKNKILK